MGESIGRTEETSIAYKIIQRVSQKEGEEISSLPPLYHRVNPDALNSLAESEGVRVEFTYYNHTIVINDGDITIDE